MPIYDPNSYKPVESDCPNTIAFLAALEPWEGKMSYTSPIYVSGGKRNKVHVEIISQTIKNGENISV